ncbi:MAG: ribonuclease catalytic domain-containing protein [Syntrophobacteraceae bacterium]
MTSVDVVPGTLVEFFENRQVLCGVCTAVKNNRLAILTEQNKEASLSQNRLVHVSRETLDLRLSRDDLVARLHSFSVVRKQLMADVSVEELWSLLKSESEGFSVRDLAELVFSGVVSDHHVAATQRVLFQDRLYFQFKDGQFIARPADKIEQRRMELVREEARAARIESGAQWVHAAWNRKGRPLAQADQQDLIECIKSYCLFGQESPEAPFVKELFKRASIPQQQSSAFRFLVRIGVWREDENLYLHEESISAQFPVHVEELANRVAATDWLSRWDKATRRDLRHLDAFTIDSLLTRDYDDALSVETRSDGTVEVGVHIADAAEVIAKGDGLDREAEHRASSIYLPDGRITMLPATLSEGLCSLRAGEDRLAVSFLMRFDEEGAMRGQEICTSVVRIREQLTYEDVNERVRKEPHLHKLHDLALKHRQRRLAQGAIILPLPEIQVYVNPVGMIQMSRYEKETPSQIMVSEWMIAANALAAAFLADRKIPTLFRNQAECKPESDFVQSSYQLFYVYRQRRLFARAEMDIEPHGHCSLALPHYTMATSPIRRYSDLVVQRQLKQALVSGEPLYSEDELRQLIIKLGSLQTKIAYIQRKWTRYWLLKYLEQEDVQTLDALVLEVNDRFAHVLLPEYLMEANVPVPEKGAVPRGELIRVRVDKVHPREDVLRLQLLRPPGSSTDVTA